MHTAQLLTISVIMTKSNARVSNRKVEESKNKVELDETISIRCLFTQCTLKGVIKKCGEDRENAGLEKMQQLHDKSVFKPACWKQLSREQKRQALESLIFIKKKRLLNIERSNMY